METRPDEHCLIRVSAKDTHGIYSLVEIVSDPGDGTPMAPVLFDDDPAAAQAERRSPVAPAQRSPRARHKASTNLPDDGAPVHSFRTLLRDLATVAKNRILPKLDHPVPFELITTPTALQQRAFDLLAVNYRM